MERTITVPAREHKPFKYGEYLIIPRLETGWFPEENNYGFWVTKNSTNIMPGACWFHSVREAIDGVKKLELAKGNATLFWLLMGNGGLTITSESDRARFDVKCGASVSASVDGRKGNAKLNLHFKKIKIEVTPTEALAIATMLIEGAERTLGKEL